MFLFNPNPPVKVLVCQQLKAKSQKLGAIEFCINNAIMGVLRERTSNAAIKG